MPTFSGAAGRHWLPSNPCGGGSFLRVTEAWKLRGLLYSQDGRSRAILSSNGASSRGAGRVWAGPTCFGPHFPVVKMGVNTQDLRVHTAGCSLHKAVQIRGPANTQCVTPFSLERSTQRVTLCGRWQHSPCRGAGKAAWRGRGQR